jgi:hypothetical protein
MRRIVRQSYKLGITSFLGLLTTGFLAACSATTPEYREGSMNWMKTPRTLCIGRAVLQLPLEMQSKWQKYSYNGDAIETTHNISLARFNDLVTQREQELLNNKRKENTGTALIQTTTPWLETSRSPQPQSRLFVFRKTNNQRIRVSYETEGYLWESRTMFLLRSGADDDKVAVAIADDLDKMSRIKARDNDTVPTDAGYCFDGGIVTGGNKFYELATAYFARPTTPGGATFGIEMRPTVASDDTLFERLPKLMQSMGDLANHVQTLRRGDRNLAGLDGQEMLTKVNADGITAYIFIWETKGKPDAVLYPNTHIEFQIGGDRNKQTDKRESSILSEDEALSLWDSILNSFRFRPGAV